MPTRVSFRAILLCGLSAASLVAQDVSLRWRSIGPFRGGRIRAMAGVASQPYTFYFAQGNGGVWKTTDAGRTWWPIFDEHTQSVGSIGVAASDPNIIYVGSGEALPRPDLSVGDGVYKSTDAGKTWAFMGLPDAQQIPQIAVDPRDPDRLFVAALGHPYGPSKARGIYRSTDGGKSFDLVLQKDENTGGNDVDIDPTNPNIIYANLWEQRQGPWENSTWTGNNGGLFKSTDGGQSWTQLTNGLPANTNQVNLGISPSNPQRLFAAVASNGPPATVGLYRSDDGGDSWTRITTDNRPAGRIGGGDLPVPIMHPLDPETIIMASTVSWKSTDGGRTWAPFKGAPGGEDYQNGWISPVDPNIIFMVADQGAVVSLNGGETWSSWYNQPNAMLYHVAADNAFPYRLCSGQQESGSACVSSRGNYGAISDRDWLPVGVDEYGYVAPDPLNPDIVYGGRAVTRFDRRTGQVSTVGPLAGRQFAPGTSPYRQVRTQPVVFSQANPKMLLFGNNFLWKTLDGGANWTQIAGDMTRKTYSLPASIGKYADPALVQQRGVIYTIGPSPIDTNTIWFGTDDGQVFTTANGGKKWTDVTPPGVGAWWKVFMVDAGHFDKRTAYVAVNTLRLDDMNPHLYRTHDGGKTWTDISKLPAGAGPSNALREDPKKRGLLYAATEKGVYVSFNDGDTWGPLQFNLPRTSIRDLIVKDDDIAVATHGRGFWILDNITPLRQLPATGTLGSVKLFAPATALRVRWNMSTDMPWPKEEPVGDNPPDGAAIDYYFSRDMAGAALEIVDARGRVVRRWASTDSAPYVVPTPATAPVPTYWYKQPARLETSAGHHRFYWDVHYQNLPAVGGGGFGGGGGGGGGGAGLPINSIPGQGAPAPRAPWAAVGNYTVRLIVEGTPFTQSITVKPDPRVKTSATGMRDVYALTDSLYFTQRKLQDAVDEARAALARPGMDKDNAQHIAAILEQPDPNVPAPANPNAPRPPGPGSMRSALSAVAGLVMSLQQADVPPTATQRASIGSALKDANAALVKWRTFKPRLPKP